jgi:serine/threonine-protein kinase
VLGSGPVGDAPREAPSHAATRSASRRWTRAYDRAESTLQAALAIRRANRPVDDAAVLWTLGFVQQSRERRPDVVGAERIARELLALTRRVYPPGHTRVASAMEGLGFEVRDLGRLSEAESLDTQALAIFRAHYAPDHPFMEGPLSFHASLLLERGDFTGAESTYERVRSIETAMYGPRAPNTLRTIDRVANAPARRAPRETLGGRQAVRPTPRG